MIQILLLLPLLFCRATNYCLAQLQAIFFLVAMCESFHYAPFTWHGWCLRPRLYWGHTPVKGFFSHGAGEDLHWKQCPIAPFCTGESAWPTKGAPALHFARTRAVWKAPLETIAISLRGSAPCEKNPFIWVCPQYKRGRLYCCSVALLSCNVWRGP